MDQKREELEEVHAAFQTFNEDFAHLFQMDCSIKEKLEDPSNAPRSRRTVKEQPYAATLKSLQIILNLFEREEASNVASATFPHLSIHDILLSNKSIAADAVTREYETCL